MMFEYCANQPGILIAYMWIDGLQREEFLLGKPVGSKPKLPDLSAHKGKIPVNPKKN